MSKRPANNPKKNKSTPPTPRPWAKYLTAIALGLIAGWSFPPQAQAPDMMEDLETLIIIPRPEPQTVPAPPRPNVVSERPFSGNESLIAVPPPPWYRIKDRLAQGPPLLPGLQPEFGTAQGSWRNIDVGQANEALPPLTDETEAANQFDQPTEAPAKSAQQGLPPGREQLKDLFGDMFVADTDQVEPSLAEATPSSAPIEAAASIPAPELAGLARIIAPGRPGLATATKSDKTDKIDKAAKADKALKAAPPVAASPPSKARGPSPGPSLAASARPSRKASQSPVATTPRRPLSPAERIGGPKPHLVLINETGRAESGQEYQRVLEAMNYKVIAVHDRAPQQGATFISYRPGQKAQALALSQRLPGRRLALEAQTGECLPTEITIYIR